VTERTVLVGLHRRLGCGDLEPYAAGTEDDGAAVAVRFDQRMPGRERRSGQAQKDRQHREASQEARYSTHVFILGVRRQKRQADGSKINIRLMELRRPLRRPAPPADLATLRTLADQTLSRTAGAPLISGNSVRVLRDAAENYPAWTAAMERATSSIHVEMYIFHDDAVGRRFVALLAEKARAGVTVRILYDWFGCGWSGMAGLFRPAVEAGAEVHAFNPPSIKTALGWVRRNHRKLIVVDGQIAFVAGLCIGQVWEGIPERQLEPWRDTGVELIGPVVAEAEASFARSWAIAGGQPFDSTPEPDASAPAGSVSLRLIPTEPFTGNVLRMDLLIASVARRSLWITDAYFIGTGPYLESLIRAARDGVDVRLLLPQGSDVGWVVPVSRSLYRPLLEAGVRIYEWNGTMVHAKSAVADGRWCRIGSTNLNLNSWMGNWELDVAIEDQSVAATLGEHFTEDLARSTEIVLENLRSAKAPQRSRETRPKKNHAQRRATRRVLRSVTGVGRSVGAAVTGNRSLEDFEATPLTFAAAILLGFALIGFFFPRLLAFPVAGLAMWVGLTFLAEAWTVWRHR
jgi:cardiolipin synthase